MFQKMLFTILITISVLLTVTVVFPHEKGFSVTIPQATMPPEIDGIGKDLIWQFAPEVTIDNINTGGKVKKGEVQAAIAGIWLRLKILDKAQEAYRKLEDVYPDNWRNKNQKGKSYTQERIISCQNLAARIGWTLP